MKIAIDPGHRYVKFFDGSHPPLVIPTVLGEPQNSFTRDISFIENGSNREAIKY